MRINQMNFDTEQDAIEKEAWVHRLLAEFVEAGGLQRQTQSTRGTWHGHHVHRLRETGMDRCATCQKPRRNDITGLKFGRLTVTAFVGRDKHRNLVWVCACDCGKECEVVGNALRSGHTRSCGCLRREVTAASKRALKHGLSSHPLYKTWVNIMNRCYNESTPDYAHYGARGITVCERWHDPATFIAEVSPRPTPAHTVDRIDVDGNYEPSNFRWATRQEQARNLRAHKRPNVGISRHRDGRFVASIPVDGKRKHLGLFNAIEDAREVRARAEKQFWGRT